LRCQRSPYSLPAPAAATVVINEVMSSNSATVQDPDGDYSDWVELYNSGPGAVDLAGWGLSDDPTEPQKWTFPSQTIAVGEHLLVWASDKDQAVAGQALHANWKISAGGETIVLTRADNGTEDSLAVVALQADQSYGRSTDGGDELAVFTEPTPGVANADAPLVLAAPTLSFPAGFYSSAITVTLESPDSDVTLRYTIDGSTPTETSAVYSSPLNIVDRSNDMEVFARINTGNGFQNPGSRIVKGTVLRARAFKSGATPSDVVTATYFIGPQFEGRWEHPVISIAVDRDDFFGSERGIYVRGSDWTTPNWDQRGDEWERPVNVEMFEVDGQRVLAQKAGARINGGASRASCKKSLRLYARSEYGASNFEYPVFPDQPHDSYKRLILRNGGNDVDRSILRDGFMQALVGHMNFETQAYRPSIVFINGEYWGIHNIRERYDQYYFEQKYGVDPDAVDVLENNGEVSEGSDTATSRCRTTSRTTIRPLQRSTRRSAAAWMFPTSSITRWPRFT
jgi:hypothetical protein